MEPQEFLFYGLIVVVVGCIIALASAVHKR